MKRQSLIIVVFSILFINITGILAKEGSLLSRNICQVLKHHPSWRNSLIKADKRYNISPAFTLAVIHQESKFHANAKNRHSSAFGYAQAVDGTWRIFQKDVEPYAKRNDFNDSVEFIDWYMAQLAHKLHIKTSNSFDLYLAYMLGEGGYRDYMDNSYKSSSMLHREAIAAKVRLKSQVYSLELKDCKI
ncbi:transglycosylase SLT domain-containing protein [Francisella sp. SYW-9]|uniref:transglycosylase SLT domain-containing protein n=1 Tax=Francisella sp. SYW-9 TaxID=2610888 RepID=UPI00123DF09C|nr:transglycosylase SLT domain-containing protein [Francisella sp. SYW-9]